LRPGSNIKTKRFEFTPGPNTTPAWLSASPHPSRVAFSSLINSLSPECVEKLSCLFVPHQVCRWQCVFQFG